HAAPGRAAVRREWADVQLLRRQRRRDGRLVQGRPDRDPRTRSHAVADFAAGHTRRVVQDGQRGHPRRHSRQHALQPLFISATSIRTKEPVMKRTIQNERGMALALAIVALVIVGALIAGAFFAGTQEQRVGENSRYSQSSFGVAEGATNYLIGHWNPQVYNRSKAYPLDSVKVPTLGADTVSPSHTGRYAGYVYRLNSELYLIDLTGQDSTTLAAGGAFRRRGGGGR